MLTKDELLRKGISEEVADEIIAAADSDGDSENSLQALEKAISGDVENGLLFKAKGGEEEEEEEEEEEYNEEYMRKYMKKYMKENKSACAKAAKEVGLFADKMEKARADFDMDAEGAIVEMADLKPILDAQSDVNSAMAKAVQDLSRTVETIVAQNEQAFDLMKKAAAVQVETAKGIDSFLSTPQGRKGITASADMQKAQSFSPELSKVAYSVLMKAVHNKDEKAGMIISAFESAGKRLDRLNPAQRAYITELIQKEGK